MRAALILLAALLLLAALGAAALCLGAFSSVSGGGGALLSGLAAAEGLLSGRLFPGLGLAEWGGLAGAFGRGLGWAALVSALVWLAAYLVILARPPQRPVRAPAPSPAGRPR